tara:strand:- start:458 stop:637 length:180 start_codon:yes stop_codon:yes gene_type:complete
MQENFTIREILEAVGLFLESEGKEKLNNKNKKKSKNTNNLLPSDTENIILQAESYLKKK